MSTLHTKGLKEEVKLCNLPTMRQSFVVASLLIILGNILGYFVHTGFFILTLIVAGGLMFSGVVGICPMVHILQKLPWNKQKSQLNE